MPPCQSHSDLWGNPRCKRRKINADIPQARLLASAKRRDRPWPVSPFQCRAVCLSAAASTAAIAVPALLGALDAWLTTGHSHTVTDRYRHAHLLLKGQCAAGSAAVGSTGDTGTALAGHRRRSHNGGGIQRQGRGDIHTLCGHLIAAAGRAGLLRRAGLKRLMLIGFIDSQRSSLISWKLYPAVSEYTPFYANGTIPAPGSPWKNPWTKSRNKNFIR